MGVLPSKAGYQDTEAERARTSVTNTALGGAGGSVDIVDIMDRYCGVDTRRLSAVSRLY